jgi:(R,R)-butanediol dehydrogenase/meso-butanediol dehydrogenase/diacetyl reductase
VQVAKYQDRMVIVAANMKPVEFPVGRMLTSEMTTAMGYPTEMPEVIAALPRLREKIASMIRHRLPLSEIMDGLRIAAGPESCKIMIEIEREKP